MIEPKVENDEQKEKGKEENRKQEKRKEKKRRQKKRHVFPLQNPVKEKKTYMTCNSLAKNECQ